MSTWLSCTESACEVPKVSMRLSPNPLLQPASSCAGAFPLAAASRANWLLCHAKGWAEENIVVFCRYHGGGVCGTWTSGCAAAERERPGHCGLENHGGQAVGQCLELPGNGAGSWVFSGRELCQRSLPSTFCSSCAPGSCRQRSREDLPHFPLPSKQINRF